MLRFLPREPSLQGAWDELIRTSPDGWVFSTFAWQDVIGAVPRWGLEDRGFGVERDGKLVAVMPLHYVRAIRLLCSTGFGHGGPALSADVPGPAERKLTTAILDECRRRALELAATKFSISICPLTRRSLENRWGVNPLVMNGFFDCSTHTSILALDTEESRLWARLSQSARQAIRRAREAGYTVERVEWPLFLDRYYEIHQENYRRTGVTPHPREYFEGIATQIAARGHSVLWAAHSETGEVVAFHNSARFGTAGLYHTGCSRTEHLASGVNYLLLWEAILGARRDGLRWYEVGELFPGASSGKEFGLTVMKSKFGGEIHRTFRGEMLFNIETASSSQPRVQPTSDNTVVAPWRRLWQSLRTKAQLQ
jgi:hypothetical protein